MDDSLKTIAILIILKKQRLKDIQNERQESNILKEKNRKIEKYV